MKCRTYREDAQVHCTSERELLFNHGQVRVSEPGKGFRVFPMGEKARLLCAHSMLRNVSAKTVAADEDLKLAFLHMEAYMKRQRATKI